MAYFRMKFTFEILNSWNHLRMGMFLQTNVRTNEFNFYCGKMINTIPQSDSNSSKNFIVFMFESTTDSRRLPLVLGVSDSASLRFSPSSPIQKGQWVFPIHDLFVVTKIDMLVSRVSSNKENSKIWNTITIGFLVSLTSETRGSYVGGLRTPASQL